MKLRNLFFIATACTGLMFTSCTNELDETVGNGIEQVQAEAFASISFQMPSTAGTRAENEEVVGSSEENQITNVMILLFDQAGAKVQVEERLRADFAPSIVGGATSYTLKADKNIAIATANNYQVHVIVNPATSLVDADIATLAKYNEYIETVAKKSGVYCTDNKFMMTNATPVASINITKANNKDNPAHMTIPVERLAAKFTFDNSKNKTFIGTSEALKIGDVTFDAYKVINTRNDAFKLRRVSNSYTMFPTDFSGVGGAELNNYVVENRFASKATWDETGIYNNYYSRRINTYVAFRTLEATGSQDIAYALENTIKATENQPIGYTSGVILRGKVTLKPEQLTGTIAAGAKGTFYGFRTKFYANLSDIKAAFTDNVLQIPADATSEAEIAYFNSIINNKAKLYDLGVELYANGYCYYNYWIRHNNDTDAAVNAPMEYAIVRNNVYQLAINSVSGMGNFESGTKGPADSDKPADGQEDVDNETTNPNPEIPGTVDPSQEPTAPVIPLDPGTPVIDTKMYLNMALKVLPWTVRKNDIDL